MKRWSGVAAHKPRQEVDPEACVHCAGTGLIKACIWDRGEIVPGPVSERCPFCGGTGRQGKNWKRSEWDDWKEQKHGS